MAVRAAVLEVVVRGNISHAENALSTLGKGIDGFVQRTSGAFGSQLTNALTTPFRVAGNIAQTALGTAIGIGLNRLTGQVNELAFGGFNLNSSFEQVRASLNAFTKDAGVTEQLLTNLKIEAAQTPFGFQELAKSLAALMPVSRQSGAALDDLMKTAQVLAASNPAQGLEGAAYSLREAMSGDWTSLIDRFNLSRSSINKLKEEGVPNLEIIRRAMLEMGYDADLITGMAQTWQGRLSTFKDSIDTLRASFMQPTFDLFKSGLEGLQPVIDRNMPRLQEFATSLGTRLADSLRTGTTLLRGLVGVIGGRLSGDLKRTAEGAGLLNDIIGMPNSTKFIRFVDSIRSGLDSLRTPIEWIGNAWATLGQALSGDWTDAGSIIDPFSRIAGAIGLLGNALREGGIVGLLEQLGPSLSTVFDTVAPIVAGQLSKLVEGVKTWVANNSPAIADVFKGWGEAAWRWVTDTAVPLAAAKLSLLGQAIYDNLPAIGQQIVDGLAELGTTYITPAVNRLWAAFSLGNGEAGLEGGFTLLFREAGQMLEAGWNDIANAIWARVETIRAELPLRLQAWADGFVTWLPGAYTRFIESWPGTLDGILTSIEEGAGPLLSKLGAWTSSFVGWAISVTPEVLGGLVAVVAGISGWIEATKPVLREHLGQWAVAFYEWIDGSLLASIDREVRKIDAEITTWITNVALPAIQAQLVEWQAAFVDWLNTVSARLAVKLQGVSDGIVAWIGRAIITLRTEAAALGTSIVEGIAIAIRNGAGIVGAAIRDVVSSMFQAAADALISHSPSQRAHDEIGLTVPQGVAGGILAGIPLVRSAAVTMTDSLIGAIGERRGLIQRMLGSMVAVAGFAAPVPSAVGTGSSGQGWATPFGPGGSTDTGSSGQGWVTPFSPTVGPSQPPINRNDPRYTPFQQTGNNNRTDALLREQTEVMREFVRELRRKNTSPQITVYHESATERANRLSHDQLSLVLP